MLHLACSGNYSIKFNKVDCRKNFAFSGWILAQKHRKVRIHPIALKNLKSILIRE